MNGSLDEDALPSAYVQVVENVMSVFAGKCCVPRYIHIGLYIMVVLVMNNTFVLLLTVL